MKWVCFDKLSLPILLRSIIHVPIPFSRFCDDIFALLSQHQNHGQCVTGHPCPCLRTALLVSRRSSCDFEMSHHGSNTRRESSTWFLRKDSAAATTHSCLQGKVLLLWKKDHSCLQFWMALYNSWFFIDIFQADKNSRIETIKEIRRRAHDKNWHPIAIFPEGTCTNRMAYISFKPGAFIPGLPVQPVLLKYKDRVRT